MSVAAVAEAPKAPAMGTFERYLTLWVALCILCGIVLGRLLPGPFCSLMLADFGADVIKVEDTGMGDYARWSPPYYEGVQDSAKSALFLSLNRNKRSLRIDLKSDGGRDAFLRLARTADVVLESFRPGVLDRLGVGYDRLRAENPGLVYCAISGYGQDGPNRDRSGHDMNYLGLVGLLGLTGERGGPPVVPPLSRGFGSTLFERMRKGEFPDGTRTLRAKIEPNPHEPTFIQTVRDVGYRFEMA